MRGALTGGKHQLLLGFASPEQTLARNSYLRRAFVRRSTDCESAVSSGQHSLAGGRRIPKSPTPLRRALTGGRHQLPLGFASPELAGGRHLYFRGAFVRRRTGYDSALISGESPVTGGGRHRRAGIGSLCKIFLTFSTHFPLQIIPTGVLLSTDNRNLKTL